MIKLLVAVFLPALNLTAQVAVKILLNNGRAKDLVGIPFVTHMLSIPAIWMVAAAQLLGFILWGFVISRFEIGLANALVGSSYYLLSAVVGMLLFQEYLTFAQWIGIFFISLGAILLFANS